ncbi:phospholipase D-like domain-containing protein [Flagellimonas sp. GZD32]|uniref:phospholipase D-like domain-containing protein n=1 Tax=Flagellimonas cixiensis TaxID=3228750 RepID=UPI0035C94174
MSKILSAIESSNSIEQVISEAEEHIVIVTPYLKITTPLMSRLSQADKKGVKIILVYGKEELKREQKDKLKGLKNLNLYFLKNLHAKCYLNESSGILSSMNLYEYSQVNNWELGIGFDLYDTLLLDQLTTEVELMLDSAETKIESFKRFSLHKKTFLESLTEFLNNHFKTEKFIHEKFIDEFMFDYIEEVKTKDFLSKNINIEIFDDATRVDFVLNFKKSGISKFEFKY